MLYYKIVDLKIFLMAKSEPVALWTAW